MKNAMKSASSLVYTGLTLGLTSFALAGSAAAETNTQGEAADAAHGEATEAAHGEATEAAHSEVADAAHGATDAAHGAAEGAHGGWFEAENIVLAAVLLFVFFVMFKAGGAILGMLDERGNKVRRQLAEAQKLREEAQAILGEMKAKQEAAKEDAAKIVAQAKADAEHARAKAMADLEASIANRQAAAAQKIRQAEISAVEEVKQRAIELASQAATKVLANHLAAGNASGYMDTALKEVQSRLS